MRQISVSRAAAAVGIVAAAWHAVWVLLVGLGWAKSVLDFIFELHFIKLSYALAPFSALAGMLLITLGFCGGALIGAIFAVAWNGLTLESEPKWARDTHRTPLTD